MYIIGQTGQVIVNSEHAEFFYAAQQDNMLVILARTKDHTITLGRYKTAKSVIKAMADLGLALIAGDSNRMNAYAMRPDDPETEQKTGEAAADGPES